MGGRLRKRVGDGDNTAAILRYSTLLQARAFAIGVGIGRLSSVRLDCETRRAAGWALATIGALTTILLVAEVFHDNPQQTIARRAGDDVPPIRTSPRRKRSFRSKERGMRATLLHESNGQYNFALIFDMGDEDVRLLQQIAHQHRLSGRDFTAIGGFQGVTRADTGPTFWPS